MQGRAKVNRTHSLAQEDEVVDVGDSGADITLALNEELRPENNPLTHEMLTPFQEEEPLEAESLSIERPERMPSPAHKYNHCSVCNSELGFTHLTHFEYNTVIEEAFCYVCQNKAKKQNHQLQ